MVASFSGDPPDGGGSDGGGRRVFFGGSILDAVSSSGGPSHEGEEAQMSRILAFLERWLSEPVLSALLLEHRGAGDCEVLDTVLVKSVVDDGLRPLSAMPSSSDDDGNDAAALADEALEARARRVCDQRPSAAEVAHRFGLKIGEHAPRLRRGDHPRYVLLAQSASHPRQLAQCEVWAELPGHSTGGGGGGGLLALRAVPDFDRGPLVRGHDPRTSGQVTAASYGAAQPQQQVLSAADVVRTEATSAGLVRVLTRHIDQIMKTQGRSMDASLGAMAALNDKLLERTHLLENQHTETLKMQGELHRKWLQAESDRVRTETLASVEVDIQRAKREQEKAKGEAFTQVVDLMRPAAAALTCKMQGADIVMRFINSFPEGALEMIWPMLSEEQQAMLQEAAALDDAMMEAINQARQRTTNVVLDVMAPGAGAAAKPEPAQPAAAPPPQQPPAAPSPARPAATAAPASPGGDVPQPPPAGVDDDNGEVLQEAAPVAQRRPQATPPPQSPQEAQQDEGAAAPQPAPVARCTYASCTAAAPSSSGAAASARPSASEASASEGSREAPSPQTSVSPVFVVRGALSSPGPPSPAPPRPAEDPRQAPLPFDKPEPADDVAAAVASSGALSPSPSSSSLPPPNTRHRQLGLVPATPNADDEPDTS